MSLDATEIVIQTLEEQVSSLQERGKTFLLDISEHKGAMEICEQMAKSVLGYADLIEKRLRKQLAEDEITEKEAQIVRVYSKNLIVRLHNACDSNAKSQFNEGFVARGRMAEAQAQSDILVKQIGNRRAFALGQKDRAEAAETKFDSSDVDTTPIVDVEGTTPPAEAVPEPIVESESEGHQGSILMHVDKPVGSAAIVQPAKKVNERLKKKSAKKPEPSPKGPPEKEDTQPNRRNIHRGRGKK
jgi:hypothetical protein